MPITFFFFLYFVGSCELHGLKDMKMCLAEKQLIDTQLIDMSVGHLNFSGPHVSQNAPRAGLIVLQALGAAISRLSPILHWRLSPELRQEGRPAQ